MAEFEHSLFMLLLAVGLFSALPTMPRRTLVWIGIGLLLTLLPPFVHLPIPWTIILSLFIPLLFWQSSRFWLRARWRLDAPELAIWALVVGVLAAIFWMTGSLGAASALLFGVVAASILWRTLEVERNVSYAAQVGPLTLVFLLTEVDLALEAPGYYLGSLASGAAVGILVALLALALASRLLPPQHGWLALGQAYLAYWAAGLIGVSPVAACLIAVALYSELSLRRATTRDAAVLPAPFNQWPVFAASLAVFVLLGWQAHQPLTPTLILEALVGFAVGWAAGWLIRRLNLRRFAALGHAWQAGLRLGLFVLAALLLWPRSPLFTPLHFLIAFGLALLVIFLSLILLTATMSLREEIG